MKKYTSLIIITSAAIIVTAIIRLTPTQTIVTETVTEKYHHDTIRILQTPDKKYFRAKYIELNTADSAMLRSVYGIGATFSARIVKYRNLIGGFYSKEQLRDVYGITEEVYHNISVNFWVNTLAIRKININFATPKQLRSHPYITAKQAEMIYQALQMKGGYVNTQQLIDDNIFNAQEARKIAPYLSFDTEKQ